MCVLGIKSDPLQEQHLLLSPEPFLQPFLAFLRWGLAMYTGLASSL